jgi:hypothetical protein
MARFKKSARNHRLEVWGKDFVLLDRRFPRPDRSVKTEILHLIGLSGNFTGASFDLAAADDRSTQRPRRWADPDGPELDRW